jgi:hypothetical protein
MEERKLFLRGGYEQESLRPAALVSVQGVLAFFWQLITSPCAKDCDAEPLSCTSNLFFVLLPMKTPSQ